MVELVGDGEEIKTGQRVMVSDGHRGTVCYVGPLPSHEGIWLGVDWDDPARGKHDGSVQGVRYFTPRLKTSGSFIRKEKVNLGRSCAAALKLRYGESDITNSNIEEQLLQVKKALNAPFLEMVGFDCVNKKQSCFDSLLEVWLHDYAISHAGEPNELKALCPNIRELDISKNLLSSWKDIVEIARQLRYLTVLNLSENLLRIPEDIEELKKDNPFPALNHLILTNMNYTWWDILLCAQLWPKVHHLQVPFNRITTLDESSQLVLKNLKTLDLEGNNIEKWEEINKLGSLPLLEILNLCNTGLSNITIPDDKLFKQLKQLLISQNNISSWADINELDKLELEELRFRENPVLAHCSVETNQQIIIACVASLKLLNGQTVTREDRIGAEWDYIKRYGQKWEESKDTDITRENFLKTHPSYLRLIKKYGEAESSECVQASMKLKSNLLKLEIINQSTGQKIFKSVPRAMLVQKLLGLIQKLFKINSVPSLHVISTKNPALKVAMDNPLKMLDFYSIEDGDQVVVEW